MKLLMQPITNKQYPDNQNCLAMNQDLTDEEIDHVSEKVLEFDK